MRIRDHRRRGASAPSVHEPRAHARRSLRLLGPEELGFLYERGRFKRPREFVPDPTRNERGFHDAPVAAVAGPQRVILLAASSSTARSSGQPWS